jgi:uncharacterized membrane protein YjgN (DUF898 family)
MKRNTTLVICSLLALLLLTFHLTDDIVRGISPADATNLTVVPFLALFLYGTLELAERRSGHIIMFFVGLLSLAMPWLHLRGTRYGAVAASSGGFFFVWTLFALGGLGLLCMVLSVRELWTQRPAAK